MKRITRSPLNRKICAIALTFLLSFHPGKTQSQMDIFSLMERTDLNIRDIEHEAEAWFQEHGTGRGSGYKQYQRWLYERRFHLNESGFLIPPADEDRAYQESTRTRGASRLRSGFSWTELGPSNWAYTSGWNPGVGRITALAIHPSDTTVVYISSPGGGIWKSTNSGQSWTPLIDYVNAAWMNVFHIHIDPGNTSTIYASLTSGGVIKSTNAGASWSATGTGPTNSRMVKVHPANSSIVFAAATNGLWRSANGGSSWTRVEPYHKEDIEFNPLNPNTMYAAGNTGPSCVWRSTDNGVTWSAISGTAGIVATGRTLLAVSPNNPAIVYAVQANGNNFGRLYKSTDSGQTWSTTITGSPSAGTNFFGYETNGTGTTGQATYDMAICTNPINADEVHIGGIICWKSTNGGTSFSPTTAWFYPNTTGYNHADVHALEWINGTIYAGTDGGLYKSIKTGKDWVDLSAGLGIRQFYRLANAKSDSRIITTGSQDNGSSYRRTNGNWVDWLGADGMDNCISPTNPDIAYGTSQNGGIYKTTNAGASRVTLTQPANGNWVTPLCLHPSNHDTIWGGWTGVWRSDNGGSSWTNISGTTIGLTLDALAVSPANTRYIYTSRSNTLYITKDGGANWSSVTAPAAITSIFASSRDPEKIWITCNNTTNRFYVSTDAGASFTNLSTGLPSLAARSVAVDEDSVETIYVGMNIGVWYRDNITNTWAEHATGLPLVAINEVEIQKSGAKLRVATYGRGIWESGLRNQTPQCLPPTALNTSNVSTQSATLNWTSYSNAGSYSVDYKRSLDSTWTSAGTAISGSSVSLSGLSASTSYNWRIRSNCTGLQSSYANASFTTAAIVCNSPAGLNTDSIGLYSAVLKWQTVSNALSYSADYRKSSDTGWTNLGSSLSQTRIALNGLSATTSYVWRVRTNCNGGNSSFTQSGFTTLQPCGNINGLKVDETSSTNAILVWDSTPAATQYQADYRASGSSTWISAYSGSNRTANLNSVSAGAWECRVRAQCPSGNGSYETANFLIWCASSSSSTNAGHVKYVSLNNLTRSSTSDNGYYNGEDLTANVKPGTQYTLTFAAGSSNSRLTSYWRFYIDYNADGDFTDANERVAEKTLKNTSNNTVKFTIPTGATLGKTRIRIAMATGAYPSACGTVANGETEDYSLNITQTPDHRQDDPIANSELNDLHIYPNPVSGDLRLKYQLLDEVPAVDFRIIDLQGRTLAGSRGPGAMGENQHAIDMRLLPPGRYILQMISPGEIKTLPVMVVR